MRRLLALSVVVSSCYSAPDWKPSRPGEIFRWTAIGKSYPLDSIVLGQSWSSAAKYGAAPGDTLFELPAGTFAGSKTIRVRRNASGAVIALEFDYAPEHNVSSLREEYVSAIGLPTEAITDTVDGALRHVSIWRDSTTEFRIIQFARPRADSLTGTATLSDRILSSGGLTRS